MINVPRMVHPSRSGGLDPPTWEIGRALCRPRIPDCLVCVLDGVCAHRIMASAGI